MLHHLSFNARDTARAARVLAELLDGSATPAPQPPFPVGSWFVCARDEHGTLIEVMPWGEVRDPASRHGIVSDPLMRPKSGCHFLVGTPLAASRVLDVAAREGWRAETGNAGAFQFVKVWVENSFLVEFLPPDLVDAYVRAIGAIAGFAVEDTTRDLTRT